MRRRGATGRRILGAAVAMKDVIAGFVVWAVILSATSGCLSGRTTSESEGESMVSPADEGRLIFDFEGTQGAEEWQTINDTVMGGASSSRMETTAGGTAVFLGNVSLENYGGFASVRSPLGDYDLSSSEGVEVRVKGDGKTYKLGVRDDAAFDGVVHQADFRTQPGVWEQIRIPFSELVPTYHGRMLESEPPLDRIRVKSFSFLIADKQEGPFSLEIAWVRCF
jgi:hypothetical protein